MEVTPVMDASSVAATGFVYLLVPLTEAKSLEKDDEDWTPEQLNQLGEDGWDFGGPCERALRL